MSRKNLTRWTCDRCGTQKDAEPDREPVVWGGRVVANLPGMRDKALDLCNPCEVSLRHYLKRDPSWALYEHFTDLALDYFNHPAGTAGNKERADRARAAAKRAYDYEVDSTPFLEAGFFLGDPKDWATDGSLTGSPDPTMEQQ